MHPFVRTLVAAIVVLLLAAGVVALGLLSGNPASSIWAILAGSLVTAAVGFFVFVRAWTWSTRASRSNQSGPAAAIAVAGGVMFVLAAGALAVALVMALLFVLG
jgi:hypothetical protein